MKIALLTLTLLFTNIALANIDADTVTTTGKVLNRSQPYEVTEKLAKKIAVEQAKLACASEKVEKITDWTIWIHRSNYNPEGPYFTFVKATFRCL